MIVKLTKVRARYMNLFTPRAPQVAGSQGNPRYDITIMVPKGSENDKALKAEFLRIAQEQWQEKALQMLQMYSAQGKCQYRDGDALAVKNPEYAGHMVLTATAPEKVRGQVTAPPEVRDADGVTRLTPASGKPYPGCWITAFVEPYVLKGDNERLNCGLRAVQFTGDNDAFAGVAAPLGDSMFDRVSDPSALHEETAPWL